MTKGLNSELVHHTTNHITDEFSLPLSALGTSKAPGDGDFGEPLYAYSFL